MNGMSETSITGFVLAGGLSARMGSDKAFLPLGGKTLLERALQLLDSVCVEVHIVGNAGKFARSGSVVEDIFPNCGPLGGIHAALNGSTTNRNLMLAVDLPFIDSAFLRYLISRSMRNDTLVTVPRIDGRWQPLCAIYRKEFADLAATALIQGKNRIDALFSSIELSVIDDTDLAGAGFSSAIFRNINTPEDFEYARHQL
jgi:molybdenum cofactor guanylyltransferase